MSAPIHTLIVDDDPTAQKLLTEFAEQHAALQITDVCDGAIEAANVLNDDPVDLLLLDVEMPKMTGLELLENLDDPPAVVLITGSEEYAVEAFDLAVTDYLVKPVRYPRFLKSINRVQSDLSSSESDGTSASDADSPSAAPSDAKDGLFTRDHMPEHAFLKVGNRLVRVALADIQFIEAKGDYMVVSTVDDEYMIYSTLKELEERLPSDIFMRVHRSYLVRLDYIEEIEDETLQIGDQKIPIGPSYRERLINAIQTL